MRRPTLRADDTISVHTGNRDTTAWTTVRTLSGAATSSYAVSVCIPGGSVLLEAEVIELRHSLSSVIFHSIIHLDTRSYHLRALATQEHAYGYPSPVICTCFIKFEFYLLFLFSTSTESLSEPEHILIEPT